MVSANPDRLHIYEPAGPSNTAISLSKPPLSLAVSPDGLHAAVGHDGLISYVDLSAAIVERQVPIAVTAQNITISADWIYVMPISYQNTGVSINIGTGAVVANTGVYYYGVDGRFNAAVNAIYGVSYNDIVKYNTSSGPITGHIYPIYNGDYSVCGPVFFSPAGDRIYNGCNTVFTASTNPALDMRYATTLTGAGTTIRSLTESAAIQQVALLRNASSPTGVEDNVVSLYESQYLNPSGQFALPDFDAGSNSFTSHGKYVFFNAASTALFVVVQADQSSGILNDFAVQTIPLAPPAPCGAVFESPNADIIAEGASGTANILASPACRYWAASTVPWIQVLTAGFGSGNNTLKYIVRANPGGPRTGAISLNGVLLTVSQRGASQPESITRLPYDIVSAAYDKAFDKLILITADPNELHIYDPVTQYDRAVTLIRPPLSVSVRPDGRYAAVGHDGWVSYVDLQAATVVNVFQVITDVNSIILAGNGYMYLFSTRDRYIYSFEISSGTVTATSAAYSGSVPRLSRDGNYLYVGGNSFSKWSIAQGVASRISTMNAPSTCGNLWLTEDGRRMFTACAKVYRVSSVPVEDLEPNGALSGATSVTWADESVVKGSTAVIPGPSSSPGAAQIQIYGDAFLDLTGSIPLPKFHVGSAQYSAYGQFVFWNRAATALIAIVKADASANLSSAYGVSIHPATIPPLANAVTFSVADAGVISSKVFAVPAAAGQAWSITSSQPWLTVNAGNGNGPQFIRITADSTGLIPGIYHATLELTSGVVTQNINVTLCWGTGSSADFNGDGIGDLLWRHTVTGDNNVWFMNGMNIVGDAWLPRVINTLWQIVGIGDFNADGNADVLWRYAPTGDLNLWYMGRTAILTDTWLPRVSDPQWQIAGTGDFNKDGRSDIVWRHLQSGDINVWFLNGGTVTGDAWLPSVTDQQWQIAGIGDFNGDGGADIVWRHTPSGDLDLWLMNGTVVTSDSWLPRVADPEWQINAIGDFNGDGNSEIIWRHALFGNINIWFMNGVTFVGDGWLPTVADQQWKIMGPK